MSRRIKVIWKVMILQYGSWQTRDLLWEFIIQFSLHFTQRCEVMTLKEITTYCILLVLSSISINTTTAMESGELIKILSWQIIWIWVSIVVRSVLNQVMCLEWLRVLLLTCGKSNTQICSSGIMLHNKKRPMSLTNLYLIWGWISSNCCSKISTLKPYITLFRWEIVLHQTVGSIPVL